MPCSSSNPCLYCTLRRTKGEWEDEGTGELRTLGGQDKRLAYWQGPLHSIYKTEFTVLSQSTVGPVLVRSFGDNDDTTILEKAPPPSVHLLLAVNDVLRPHCIKFFGTEEQMLQVLKDELGVIPHSYQGKEGACEGPQCDIILNKLNLLAPYLMEEEEHQDGWLFLNVLESFKRVKDAVFGLELAANYEEVMADFKTHLHLAHIGSYLPITPKLHIISTHVVQWVRRTGTGLAKMNEAAVEASHHVWWEVWKHYKVKSETSEVFKKQALKALVRVNADNTN